ncbi:hypothetical protein GCM10023225_02920 [Kineococcus glutinatus]|uniref:Diguanylate cyclase (GGDEF)-like protein n=1 Tax=Kineococcus glutinatus TaxID=1070872 RepID=A0ABP9H774_9ACTN
MRDAAGDDVRTTIVPWALVSPLVVVGVVALVQPFVPAGRVSDLLTTLAGGVVSAALLLLVARQSAHRLDAQGFARQVSLDAAMRQALHDPLTDLGNRQLFTDRLTHALARRAERGTAVLYMDLDGFKGVNDVYGHLVGDAMLVEVANRLRAAVRPEDTVARFGGDEFAVLCEDVGDEVVASRIAERIIASIAEKPFELAGRSLRMTPSVGIALATEEVDPSGLLRRADAALYRAKERGKARFEMFDEGMQAQALAKRQVEDDLAGAAERGELRLHYQPILDLHTDRVRSLEALLRWEHPTRGLLEPADFVPIAERTGLIVDIGNWALQEACRQLGRWYEAGGDDFDLTVSVNVSRRQLVQQNLVDVVESSLPRGRAAEALCLEVTEDLLAQDAGASVSTLHALRTMGVRIGVDDFGTGRSSPAHLQMLPIDHIKVDRQFTAHLGERQQADKLFSSIIGMARTLGIGVIAEGVESAAQLQALRRLDCDGAQGYLLGHPDTPGTVVDLRGPVPVVRVPGSQPAPRAGVEQPSAVGGVSRSV